MRTLLVITQIIYLVLCIPWLVIWGMSFMSFDQGFSWSAAAFVGVITLYPLAVITCSIIAWVLHKRKKRAAVFINLVPMLWVVALGGILLFY
ncbi:hypothetical protein [Paenibacillus sp. NEAU-GSW1]|uniref:hypothetical protein n=1 Tax=Paenibacillus sp. NEAU-GSW1 TaxID=2682486 RepID=UPI0012E181BE|nr:hypothetical protein [Paenibacillus sp. NEAU-GSW1]MUT64619.1 hypothetical protein [Paenibacillus sp. NEAU-GSW1]